MSPAAVTTQRGRILSSEGPCPRHHTAPSRCPTTPEPVQTPGVEVALPTHSRSDRHRPCQSNDGRPQHHMLWAPGVPSQIHGGQRITTHALLNSFTARKCDVGARGAGPEPSGVRPWQKTSGVRRAWSPIWIRRSVHDQRTDSPFRRTSLTCRNAQKRSHTNGFTYSPVISIPHQFSVNRVLSASWVWMATDEVHSHSSRETRPSGGKPAKPYPSTWSSRVESIIVLDPMVAPSSPSRPSRHLRSRGA